MPTLGESLTAEEFFAKFDPLNPVRAELAADSAGSSTDSGGSSTDSGGSASLGTLVPRKLLVHRRMRPGVESGDEDGSLGAPGGSFEDSVSGVTGDPAAMASTNDQARSLETGLEKRDFAGAFGSAVEFGLSAVRGVGVVQGGINIVNGVMKMFGGEPPLAQLSLSAAIEGAAGDALTFGRDWDKSFSAQAFQAAVEASKAPLPAAQVAALGGDSDGGFAGNVGGGFSGADLSRDPEDTFGDNFGGGDADGSGSDFGDPSTDDEGSGGSGFGSF